MNDKHIDEETQEELEEDQKDSLGYTREELDRPGQDETEESPNKGG